MSELYIRNKGRGRKVIAKKYEPEYKKRQLIPVEYPIKDEEEFIEMNRTIQAQQAKKEAENPSQFIASGQDEEVLWNKATESMPERQPSKFKVIAEPMPEDVNAPIKASEVVKKPERLYAAPPEEVEEELVNDLAEPSFNMGNVPVNEYVLVYGERVMNIGSISAIKETLSAILMDEEYSKEVSIEDFTCFKRIPLKMGLFINNE